MARSNVLETVGSLYDAALDRTLWPSAMRSLTSTFDGHAFTLFLLDKRTARVPLMYCHGFPPPVLEEFQAHYSALEPGRSFLGANARLPFFVDHMWIDEAAMDRHEFHAWLERAAGARYRLAGLVADTADHYGLTALQHTRRQGPAGKAGQKLFIRLLPHIQRATRISLEFGQFEAEQAARHEVLDRLSTAILLFDRFGRLVSNNCAAQAIMDEHDGLSLDRTGRLRAGLADEARALGQAIAGAAATGVGAGLDPGGAHSITRPSGKRPYLALVSPLGDRRDVLGLRPAPAAVVFLADPDRKTEVPIDLLRSTYGLTSAEARLAGALAQGRRIDEAAVTSGITVGTARSRLKAVFAKTNTHSQAELLRLAASSGGDAAATNDLFPLAS